MGHSLGSERINNYFCRLLLAFFLMSVGASQLWCARGDGNESRFTGCVGEFEYVVAKGWGENPWVGTYTILIYRSLTDGAYIDGLIADRSGRMISVLVDDLDDSGLPELIISGGMWESVDP